MHDNALNQGTKEHKISVNEHRLKRWIKSLPTGRDNIFPAAQQVQKILTALLLQKLPPAEMYTSLELLRPTLFRTVRTLTQHYIEQDTHHPQPETWLCLSLSLLRNHVSAYDKLSRNTARTELKRAALHRALATQLYLQLTYHRLHLMMPKEDWSTTHKIFLRSANASFCNTVIADNSVFQEKELSIAQLYIVSMLLSCSRINNLAEKKVLTVFQLLQQWADSVTLSTQPPPGSNLYVMVDPHTPSPASFFKTIAPEKQASAVILYIHTDKLIQQLENMLPSNDKVINFCPESNMLDPQLLMHLKLAWSEYVHRETRVFTVEKAQVCMGLENIHFFLSGQQQFRDFIGEKASLSIVYDEDDDISTIETQRSGDIWSAFTSNPDGELVSHIPPELGFLKFLKLFDDGPDTMESDSCLTTAQVRNRSTGGLCLEFQADERTSQLLIGQVLGIKTRNSQDWEIGEIRWVNHSESSSKVGIKVLSTNAYAIAVDTPLHLGQRENYCAGLLIPNKTATGPHTSLLVNPLKFSNGEYLSILQKDVEAKIKLDEPMQKTGFYSQYTCSFLMSATADTI